MKWRIAAAAAVTLAILIAIGPVYRHFFGRRPYNLVLVSIDTLRADRLGAYGYSRDTSPVIDAFAKDSVVFENTVAVTSWTIPSHMTMFSGLYPASHGVIRPQLRPGRDFTLLAEILKEKGYATFAYTGGAFMSRGFGFSRGFDVYKSPENFKVKKRGLETSIKRGAKLLGEQPPETPYFLFLHTYDVHCPLRPPPEYESMFRSPGAKPVKGYLCGREMKQKNPGFGPAEALTVSDRYDGSIRWVDNKIKSLFELLETRGDLDRTVVVITSDHGEEFFEHGILGHERTIHRQVLKVPLIIRAPGFAPRRIESPVSQVDIFSTILDLLGMPVPEQNQGISLMPMMNGIRKDSPREFQFSELDRDVTLRSFMDSSFHLIRDMESGRNLFFDMDRDREEQQPIEDEAKTAPIEHQLLEFIKALPSRRGEKAGKEPGKGEMEKLKTLGYF